MGQRSKADRVVDWSWVDDAACVDHPEPWIFFPEARTSTTVNDAARAKAVCNRCPVRAECLDYAIEHNEMHGIWGGMNRRNRQAELQRRREISDAG